MKWLLAALASFGATWGALAWRPAPAPEPAPARPPGGMKVSERRVLFNGSPSTVAVYRYPDAPERVRERLLQARGAPLEDGRLRWRDPKAGVVEAFLRPDGKGTLLTWSERQGRGWVPDGRDCPGRDLEGVARPEGWLRLFCIDASDRRMLCYAAPEGPEGSEADFAARLQSAGWKAAPGPAEARAFVRGGSRCLVSAEAAPGGSQVTVIQEER